jgi:hypothetical protein
MLVQNFKRTKFYPRFVEAVRAVFGLGRRRAAAKQNSPGALALGKRFPDRHAHRSPFQGESRVRWRYPAF